MKAPYEIRTDTICGFFKTIVVNKSNEESVLLTNDTSTWFVQEDYGTNDLADNNNIRPHYIYMPVKHDNTNILNVKNEEVGIMRTYDNEKIIDRFSNVKNLNNAYDTTDYQGRASSPFLLKYLNEASKDDRTVDERVQEYMNSF